MTTEVTWTPPWRPAACFEPASSRSVARSERRLSLAVYTHNLSDFPKYFNENHLRHTGARHALCNFAGTEKGGRIRAAQI